MARRRPGSVPVALAAAVAHNPGPAYLRADVAGHGWSECHRDTRVGLNGYVPGPVGDYRASVSGWLRRRPTWQFVLVWDSAMVLAVLIGVSAGQWLWHHHVDPSALLALRSEARLGDPSWLSVTARARRTA